MPHYTDQADFEPTPNSLLARSLSQRQAQDAVAGGVHGGGGGMQYSAPQPAPTRGSRRERAERDPRRTSSRLSGSGHGHGSYDRADGGYAHAHASHQPRPVSGYDQFQPSGMRPSPGAGGYGYSDSRDHLRSGAGDGSGIGVGTGTGTGDGERYRDSHPHAYTQRPASQHQGQGRPLYYDEPGEGPGGEEAFDVRADFDGTGPRWSEMYGVGKDKMYQPLNDSTSYSQPTSTSTPHLASLPKSTSEREELVSVPVLGPEWQKSELHELSRRGRSEVAADKRERSYRAFLRDQRGLCGVRWLTRRNLLVGLFVLIVALALVLFFTLPRPPAFQFYEPAPFTVDNATVAFSRTPANFSFTGHVNLYADTSASYLPVQFSDVSVSLTHLVSRKEIATGHLGKQRVARGDEVPVVVPVQFSYSAINTSDTTWSDMYAACGHMWAGTVRPTLRLRLVLTSSIVGLVTRPETSTQIGDVVCPFELPGDGV